MGYYRNDDFLKQLGERIRSFRTEKNLSQDDLAEKCGLPTSQIGRMERGEVNFSISYVVLLSNALEISIEDLFKTANNRQL